MAEASMRLDLWTKLPPSTASAVATEIASIRRRLSTKAPSSTAKTCQPIAQTMPPQSTKQCRTAGPDVITTTDVSVAGPDAITPPDVPIQLPDAGGACTTATDCPGPCQTCASSHACVAIAGQDDPSGHCAGTCDATGTCKSKKGQACQTVAAGCASGTTCAPDGICCDTACTGSCQACDIPGYLGTCTPVSSGGPHGNRALCGTDATCGGTCAGKADGTCSYPTKNCGAGPSCAGTDKAIGQSFCVSGTCQTPAVQACQAGFACAGGVCNTTCQADTDCTAGNYCSGGACVAKKANGRPCTSASANSCSSGICNGGVCCYTDCGPCGLCSISGIVCDWTATGDSCGSNAVCNSSHACVACDGGAACISSSNECRGGTIDCNTGAPVCAHLGNVPEGTTCNAGAGFCHTGSCTAKVGPGAVCSGDFYCISGQCVAGACL